MLFSDNNVFLNASPLARISGFKQSTYNQIIISPALMKLALII